MAAVVLLGETDADRRFGLGDRLRRLQVAVENSGDTLDVSTWPRTRHVAWEPLNSTDSIAAVLSADGRTVTFSGNAVSVGWLYVWSDS